LTGQGSRENRQIFAIGAIVAVVVGGVLVVGALRRPASTAGPAMMATATTVVSDQTKAEAVALLEAAVRSSSAGQMGTAIEQSDQALGKWPQYDAALRFAATAVPQATAVALSTQTRATAVAQAAVTREQSSADLRRIYSTKAGLSLQQYANAMGVFLEKNDQALGRPELLRDTAWRTRTANALGSMQSAADELTALGPVPQDMTASAELFTQIAAETRELGQEYAGGMADAGTRGVPFASARMDDANDLIRQANVEIRKGAPPPAPAAPLVPAVPAVPGAVPGAAPGAAVPAEPLVAPNS
jgi:hypothetical protein